MSFDKPTGLQTTPVQMVHLETPQFNAEVEQSVPAPVVDAEQTARLPRYRRLPYASVAIVTAVVLVVMEGVAVGLAAAGSADAATTIAVLLNFLTVIPFILGLAGLVLGPHRVWSAVAIVISVVANPFLLRSILSFFGGA